MRCSHHFRISPPATPLSALIGCVSSLRTNHTVYDGTNKEEASHILYVYLSMTVVLKLFTPSITPSTTSGNTWLSKYHQNDQHNGVVGLNVYQKEGRSFIPKELYLILSSIATFYIVWSERLCLNTVKYSTQKCI